MWEYQYLLLAVHRSSFRLWACGVIFLASIAVSQAEAQTYVNSKIDSIPASVFELPLTAQCEEGDVATGGGYRRLGGTLRVIANHPIPAIIGGVPTGWFVVFRDDQPGAVVEVFVVCLEANSLAITDIPTQSALSLGILALLMLSLGICVLHHRRWWNGGRAQPV